MKKYFLNFLSLLLASASAAFAQTSSDKPEMAEGMYASGKIYVVVAVLLVILSGIIFYLIRIDRKLNNLEEKNRH